MRFTASRLAAELFRDNELNSTANDEVERLNNCKNQTSKKRIQSYMRNATENLKRELNNKPIVKMLKK